MKLSNRSWQTFRPRYLTIITVAISGGSIVYKILFEPFHGISLNSSVITTYFPAIRATEIRADSETTPRKSRRIFTTTQINSWFYDYLLQTELLGKQCYFKLGFDCISQLIRGSSVTNQIFIFIRLNDRLKIDAFTLTFVKSLI